MVASLKMEGMEELQLTLKALGPIIEAAAAKAVDATGTQIRAEILKGYNKIGTGITYHRIIEDGFVRVYAGSPNAGVTKLVAVYKADGAANLSPTHTASRPGEAPAKDTGRLIGGVTYKKIGQTTVEVENLVLYGKYLEWGTRKIKPRPLWEPALERAKPRFIARLKAVIAGTYK
jgi:HK97 gp10 family phage protein